MKYGTEYRMRWATDKGATIVTLSIFDTENMIDDAAEVSITNLRPTGNPMNVSTVNNNRDKFGVFAKQLRAEFYPTSTVSAYTFAGSKDNRWYVTAKTAGDEFIFKGFLVTSEMSRPFLPNGASVINLTASDNLGLLKERKLTTDGTAIPTGYNSLIDYIRWCLDRTGMALDIYVQNNIRAYYNGAYSSTHLYEDAFLEARTFEDQIGTTVNGYSVLEKIFDKDCFIVQHKGGWWIMRPDDFDDNNTFFTKYDTTNTSSTVAEAAHEWNIGPSENSYWINASQRIEYERPYKYTKHTFKYENPSELPCNNEWSRGDLVATISDTQKNYDIQCWDRLWSNTSSDDPETTSNIYIRRIFNTGGYELERYLVQEANAHFSFIMSEEIRVQQGDKFTIGVDKRQSANTGGSGRYQDDCVQVRLYGDDGTFWTHHGKTDVASDVPSWTACTASFRTNQKWFCFIGDIADDQTEAVSLYSGESAEIPVSGKIKILIYRTSQFTATATYYSNFSFDYSPRINGSYQKYTGQSSKAERSESGYSANLDEYVSISDSPKPILKGGLFVFYDGDYHLAETFWNATPHGNGVPPDDTYLHPFEYLRVYSVMNQYRRGIRYFNGDLYGLGDSTNFPDLIHKYNIIGPDIDSDNRRFMMLSFDQNWKTCEWRAAFAETYHTSGKIFTDDFEFKYTT